MYFQAFVIILQTRGRRKLGILLEKLEFPGGWLQNLRFMCTELYSSSLLKSLLVIKACGFCGNDMLSLVFTVNLVDEAGWGGNWHRRDGRSSND